MFPLAKTIQSFDELDFFAQVKKRPGVFFGKPSLLSLRDYVLGMDYAFSFCTAEAPLQYFSLFVDVSNKFFCLFGTFFDL